MSERIVGNILEGTVIDHVPEGRGMAVFRIIQKESPQITESTAVILLNVKSEKHGKKDLMKIEGKKLSQRELEEITLVAPNATVTIISGGKIKSKEKIRIPERIQGVFACPNPNCITRNEKGAESVFLPERDSQAGLGGERRLNVKCGYCERVFSAEQLLERV